MQVVPLFIPCMAMVPTGTSPVVLGTAHLADRPYSLSEVSVRAICRALQVEWAMVAWL